MDVEIYASDEGGEIRIEDRQIVVTDSPWPAVYLSLFGGNVDDDGTTATARKQFWGNFLESDPNRRLRSRTQAVLLSLPAIPANIGLVEDAVSSDLAWLKDTRTVRDFEVAATMPGRNRVKIEVTLIDDANGERSETYKRPWGESR